MRVSSLTEVPPPMSDLILLSRLVLHYDPFSFLFEKGREGLGDGFFDLDPVEFVPNSYRSTCQDYDRRRIAHFTQELRRGSIIDPIELDNDIPPRRGGSPTWGPPIIIDGHHRACAAILTGKRRIACKYSGLVDTLEWLKGVGRADRPPFAL